MREKIAPEGLILERFRQHGLLDLTWYVEGLFQTLDLADSRADPQTDNGLLRTAVIRAYNESLLGWDGYDERNPMALVQISPTLVSARRKMLYTESHLAFMFEHHRHLAKLGITYDALMDYSFGVIADIRAAIQADLNRKDPEP